MLIQEENIFIFGQNSEITELTRNYCSGDNNQVEKISFTSNFRLMAGSVLFLSFSYRVSLLIYDK
jgi:hypothetical protein